MKVYVTNENNRLLRTLNDGVDLTKWINDQIARGYISSGVSTLASLTDVDLTGVQPEYVLTYDTLTSKWVPKFNAATGGLPAGVENSVQVNIGGQFGSLTGFVIAPNNWVHVPGSFRMNGGLVGASSIESGSSVSSIIIKPWGGPTNALSVSGGSDDISISGERNTFRINQGFTPTSGTAIRNYINIQSTVNQTGTATGISRGLYVNPTLTSAADWRSIQFDNNTGWGLYGNGTANNYLAGNLAVGTTTSLGRLTVRGSGTTSGTASFRAENSDATRFATLADDGIFTVGATNTGVSQGSVVLSSVSPFIRSYYTAGHAGVITMDISGPFPAARFTATAGYGGSSTENAAAILARRAATHINAVGIITEGLIVKETTNTTPMAGYNTSAVLDIQSTTRGFLLPRMTTAQKEAIPTPATGLQVYDTTLNQINVYNGTAWVGVGSSTIKPVATVIATVGTIPAIDLEGAGTGIYEIDMTNAGVSATFTAPTNPVNGGVYTFRFTNVTSHAIDFPSTFLDQTGNLFDGGTVFQLSANDFFTAYYNGINYICGKSTAPLTAAGTEGQIQYKDGVGLGASDNLYWDKFNSRLGIAALSPISRLHIIGQGSTNGSSSLTIQSANNATLFRIEDGGLLTLGKNVAGSTVQSSSQILASSDLNDSNIVITPKGTGAFLVGPAPDNTINGGNSRGASSVDLQRVRNSAAKIASGGSSVIAGGSDNTASGLWAVVVGGSNSTASGQQTFIGGGGNNSAAGIASSIMGGYFNITSSPYSSIGGGFGAKTDLHGQTAIASGRYATSGDNQTSDIRLRNTAANVITELFLDGTSLKAVITPTGANTSRVWNATAQCVAVVVTQGAGSIPAGSVLSNTYEFTIKRIGSITSLVGTPNRTQHSHDGGMNNGDFIISADTDNNALKIEYQPPSVAAADTVIRAMATVYLTEIGY